MAAYKLFKLVRILQVEELAEVAKYLDAPVFNTNERCNRLFRALCKFHPTMDSEKLTKERLYDKVFDKSAYDDGKMRKLMTQLAQLIERYLVIKKLDETDEVRAQLLIKALGERSDYELFKVATESRIKELERLPERGKDYFRENHLLNEVLYYHPETEKLTSGNDYLHRAMLSFEQYFTLLSLQNAADIMVRNRLVGMEVPIRYMDAVNRVAMEAGFQDVIAIRFFHHLVGLYLGQKAEDLEASLKLSLETLKYLSRYEQSFAINSLRNYAVPKLNAGSLPHAKFVFDLYRFEIENGLLVEKERLLAPSTYMNIVNVGLSIKKLNWVKEFIERYSNSLPEDDGMAAVNLCYGYWHYYNGLERKDLDEFYTSLQFYNLIPTRIGVKFDLRVRPAILRSHFEIFERKKESLDELLQHVRNFERHIQANNLYPDLIKKQYLNFVKYFKLLARMFGNPELKPPSLAAFFQQLESEDTIVLKRWLVEKGKELSERG